jgi:hypothetical protein
VIERKIALVPPGSSDGTNARLHALESRLKDLESAKAAQQAEGRSANHAGAGDPSPEESYEAWKKELRAHAEEPRDPAWAGKTQGLFAADLKTMTSRGAFEVLSVECKTTSCSATLKWPDYATAQSAAELILHQHYRANCGREVHLPPPGSEHESEPYQTTVLFTCEEWRASET